jgi:hypothetical protein
MGGIYVEVLKDVAFRLAPISRAEAEKQVRAIRSSPILRGTRGQAPADIDSIVETVLRASQLVTRTEIWEHVYDFHSEAQSNVVDVYVGYLRKKLGAPQLIHTRRGHGYVLAEEP